MEWRCISFTHPHLCPKLSWPLHQTDDRQHCLLLPDLSPAFQQVCLCMGLQCLPVNLSILTFDLVARCQPNLTERSKIWSSLAESRAGVRKRPSLFPPLVDLSPVFFKTKHQAGLSVYLHARQTQRVPGCRPPAAQPYPSSLQLRGLCLGKAVEGVEGIMTYVSRGLSVMEQFVLEMSPGTKSTSPALSLVRSTILKLKRILTKRSTATTWHLPMDYEVVDWKTA